MTVKWYFVSTFLLTFFVVLPAQWATSQNRYHNNRNYGYHGNRGYHGYNAEPRKAKDVYYGYASIANYRKPTDYGFDSIYTNRNPYIDRDYLAYRKGYRKDGINIGYHDAQDVLKQKDQEQAFYVEPEFHDKFKIAYQQDKVAPHKDTNRQQSSYHSAAKKKPADKTYQAPYKETNVYKNDNKFKHVSGQDDIKQNDAKYKHQSGSNSYEQDKKGQKIKYKEERYSNFEEYDKGKPYIHKVLDRNYDQRRKQYGRIRHEDYKPRYSVYRYGFYRGYP